MKKSVGLLSALVVTTTFIVNCQKAPDSKRRVRPTGGNGAATGVSTQEKAKLPAKVCSKDILATYTSIYKNKSALEKMSINADSADSDKESYRKMAIETLGKCDELQVTLKAETNEGCFRDNGSKNLDNALTASNLKNLCNAIGAKAEKDVQLDTSYARDAKEKVQDQEKIKQVSEKYIGQNKIFNISEQALEMMYEGNTNFGQFLVKGEVKSSKVSLEEALVASKTVCTAISDGISKDVVLKDTYLKFTSFEAAEQSIVEEVESGFKGKSTLVNIVLHSATNVTTVGALLCLNLDVAKLSVSKLEEVFGKAIVPGQIPMSAERASEPAAAASSTAVVSTGDAAAGASVTTSVSATAHVSATVVTTPTNMVAASEPVRVSVTPVATASGASVTTVTTKTASAVPVVVNVVSQELAALQLKFERLDKEATDAEKSLAVAQAAYDAEKAKGDKADQAKLKKLEENLKDEKAVATNARSAANSAKAEYEAAAKQEA